MDIKRFFLAAFIALGLWLGFVTACRAETINLMPSTCNSSRNCLDVLNDADPEAAIQIAAPVNTAGSYIVIDGAIFRATTGTSTLAITDAQMYDDAGNFGGTLNVTYSYYLTYIRYGRGQHYLAHWFITSGTFVRP
jgi:hypothetical protein